MRDPDTEIRANADEHLRRSATRCLTKKFCRPCVSRVSFAGQTTREFRGDMAEYGLR